MKDDYRHTKISTQDAFLQWIDAMIKNQPAVTREKFSRAVGITEGKLEAYESGEPIPFERACRMAMLLGSGIWVEWKGDVK